MAISGNVIGVLRVMHCCKRSTGLAWFLGICTPDVRKQGFNVQNSL